MAGDGQPGLPRRRDPDLASLATFALDSQGRVTSWSVTATRLFGHLAAAVTGRDVCDVLMTGPGQRQLVRHALAEVAAGRPRPARGGPPGRGRGRGGAPRARDGGRGGPGGGAVPHPLGAAGRAGQRRAG